MVCTVALLLLPQKVKITTNHLLKKTAGQVFSFEKTALNEVTSQETNFTKVWGSQK